MEGSVSSIIDVTRTKINQTNRNRHNYWSAKDRFVALKYEIAIRAALPHEIIWVNGPFMGKISDITIARDYGFIDSLDDHEMALADLGYLGEPDYLLCPYKKHIVGQLTPEEETFNRKQIFRRSPIERLD
jgi:hypothetical protein